jgi:tetratricopeptide (TPR) repeat protein
MYWTQLAGALLNQNKGFQALAIMDLALMMGLLDQEGELLNIVSLYIQNGLPYEASQLLEKGIKKKVMKKNRKNQELLANAFIQAKEYDKALAPLENAAKLSKDGKLYALKARLFLEKEKFKEAVALFDKALGKGLKEKDKGQVYVEKAVALIQVGDYKTALNSLDKASRFKESKKLALSWRSYIEKL